MNASLFVTLCRIYFWFLKPHFGHSYAVPTLLKPPFSPETEVGIPCPLAWVRIGDSYPQFLHFMFSLLCDPRKLLAYLVECHRCPSSPLPEFLPPNPSSGCSLAAG